MKTRNFRRSIAEINVVPYIDVMLVLLVIFMITTPLLSQGVNVDLPQAHAKALNTNRKPIVVSIDKRGNYYLNIDQHPKRSLILSKIEPQVAAALQHNQHRAVLIKADNQVRYGKIIRVMVSLQNAGVSNIGLLTAPLEKQY